VRRTAWLSLLLMVLVLPVFAACQASTPPASAPGAVAQGPSATEVESRVEGILGQLTLEEKVDLIGGVDAFYIRAVPRLNLPRLKMADGPFGVRNPGQSTAYAAGIALAATWNPGLAERMGVQLGRDARARGVHFLLAPAVNIYRAPMNGRNFEYFGEDPLLAARMAVGYIKGLQSQGVSATVKHFFANNSEFDRHHTDSIIDERTMREIYLPAFEAAVKEAHVGAIMTSYNLINGVHASQNGPFNTSVVKQEWGFDGLIMSDWTSVYDAVAAANGGLVLEMPSGACMNRQTLLPAIKDGKVTAATIDDKVRRILRTAARFGWLDRDQADLTIPAPNPQGIAVALEAAQQAMVLLKNDNGLLPLNKQALKTVAVIGPLAHPAAPVGAGSAGVQPYRAVSTLEGLIEALGPSVTVFHQRGLASLTEWADRTNFTTDAGGTAPGVSVETFANSELSGVPFAKRVDAHINATGPFVPLPPAILAARTGVSSARWTGYFTPAASGPHRMFIHDFRGEGGCRAFIDGSLVIDNWDVSKAMLSQASLALTPQPHRVVLECFRRRMPGSTGVYVRLGIIPEDALVEPEARTVAARADVVVAALGFDNQVEGESGDRTFALPIGQDLLLRDLVSANPKTVVTINSGGGVDMAGWIERVPAVVMTWFTGEQGGRALGQLLVGDANFSGRLPITLERTWEDNPNHDSYYPVRGTTRVPYVNGVFVGYRGFEQNRTQPLFPFGFGLSYTTFNYGNLTIAPAPGTNSPAYEVAFDVTNTGQRAGDDVPQLYVAPGKSSVPRPPKELKGFSRVSLKPGETRRVIIGLDARSFAYWDTASHQWKVDAGDYEILVGPSSATIALRGRVTVK
jgi:beta-glucosidase